VPITVRIGATTFLCDTAAEAAQIHRLVANAPIPTATTSVPRGASAASLPLDGGAPELEFLKKLESYIGHKIDATKMKELLGIKSEHGVGPKLAAYRRALEQQSPAILLSDYLAPMKQNDGTINWMVRAGRSERPAQ